MSARKPTTPVTEPILVLDLGSAWLRAALVVDGRPQVLGFASEGGRIPVAAGLDAGAMALGDLSRRLTLTAPRSQVTRPLRLAGLRHELAGIDGGQVGSWRQVAVARGPGADVQFELGSERWPLPRLLGALVQQAVALVQRQREVTIERVMVSVAPGSDDARRRAILQALQVAGFTDVSLVPSTTAAAIAWTKLERDGAVGLGFAGLESMLLPTRAAATADEPEPEDSDDEQAEDDDDDSDANTEAAEGEAASEEAGEEPTEAADAAEEAEEAAVEAPREQVVLVLDLGAGSFDASVVRLDAGNVEVLAARSRLDLGGDVLDDRLVEWLLERFEEPDAGGGVDLSGDPIVRARLRDVAEKAKIALSDADSHELRLPFLWADPSGPKHLFLTVERQRFERMIQDVVVAVADLAKAVVADTDVDPDDLDAIVMVGGISRIPVFQDKIEGLFGRVPETELSNPTLDDDFVVRGLALEAHRRGQRRPTTQVAEVADREVWIERDGGEPQRLVERGTPLPVRRSFDVSVIDGEYRAWLWEGDLSERDQHERGPSLRIRLAADKPRVALDVELDRNGGLQVGLGPKAGDAALRVDQRVGLSARALRRLCLESGERARIAAARDAHEQLRRRVQELARINEGWLADAKLGIDDLLRTSLQAWNRDAEASLEHGDAELFALAIESFLTLTEALPNKARNQLDAESLTAQLRRIGLGSAAAVADDGAAEGEGEVEDAEEPLGDPSEDYEGEEVEPLAGAGSEDEDSDEDSEDEDSEEESEDEDSEEESEDEDSEDSEESDSDEDSDEDSEDEDSEDEDSEEESDVSEESDSEDEEPEDEEESADSDSDSDDSSESDTNPQAAEDESPTDDELEAEAELAKVTDEADEAAEDVTDEADEAAEEQEAEAEEAEVAATEAEEAEEAEVTDEAAEEQVAEAEVAEPEAEAEVAEAEPTGEAEAEPEPLDDAVELSEGPPEPTEPEPT